MKLLLFGKGGQLGRELNIRLRSLGDVTAFGSRQVNFARPQNVAEVVREVRPDIIVNAAAYTSVDRAEIEPAQAGLVNADAVAAIATEARSINALVVHYSTDYIFDGMKPQPYVESDLPSPLSVYGLTKLAGENALRQLASRYLIFRTSWVYSSHGNNFVHTILRLSQQRSEVHVVDDQVGAPTPAPLIAEVTAKAIERLGSGNPMPNGTYHLAPRGATSWCGFARYILGVASAVGVELMCSPEGIIAISTSQYAATARRPLNSRLNSAKLESTLGEPMPHWRDNAAMLVAACTHLKRISNASKEAP